MIAINPCNNRPFDMTIRFCFTGSIQLSIEVVLSSLCYVLSHVLHDLVKENEMKKKNGKKILFLYRSGTRPPKTTCQKRYSASLRDTSAGRFVPRCTPDGHFEDVQCDGLICYCVSEKGEEITGTRTPRPLRPNCYGMLC